MPRFGDESVRRSCFRRGVLATMIEVYFFLPVPALGNSVRRTELGTRTVYIQRYAPSRLE